ncbi:MAG: hypothetical protein CMH46_14800 [Muricauda sp.]|nr:hypothetical protein [Allomuricauda sp.]MAU16795.1 hypothetical protein [Allomuricauda sp.]|tara:strand:+ start:14168 stop:14464 length:297 start_codon:yes stop_codon:yes gene_type:complete
MSKLRHHGCFLSCQRIEKQLIERSLEYCAKPGVTVYFSEIYSKPFGKPCKHWKFLTKKLTQFDEKQNGPWKTNLKLKITEWRLERYKIEANRPLDYLT